ncbi:hypothetical protein ACOJCM_10090 [Billgrantia sp. LNSP4103-1]|uniref:hypothetical protein n=1 Tax=Billgrantia sp. LNSP4103-1 TaxID=3410266 RepID=UPI00403F5A8C
MYFFMKDYFNKEALFSSAVFGASQMAAIATLSLVFSSSALVFPLVAAPLLTVGYYLGRCDADSDEKGNNMPGKKQNGNSYHDCNHEMKPPEGPQ